MDAEEGRELDTNQVGEDDRSHRFDSISPSVSGSVESLN